MIGFSPHATGAGHSFARRGIVVNCRSVAGEMSGVQRYTVEICRYLSDRIDPVAPRRPLQGVIGHAWEQTVLPAMLDGRLLWSPSNTGPLSVEKQVLTVHDVAFLEHPEWFTRRFAAWYRWLIPKLLRKVHRVISGSEFTKGRIVELLQINPDRVVVIPYGVDPRFRPYPEEEIQRALHVLQIPSRHYVLSLCTLEPRKNLRRLVEAWRRLSSALPKDLWLVLAGSKGRDVVFRDSGFGSMPARVHLTGFVPDAALPPLFSGAMVFAYPSLYEGFGLPVIEAMKSGVPVITGNLTALPEVVGDNGVMVDPRDTDAIAGALLRLIDDAERRAELAALGLKHSRRFSWQRAAELTLEVLAEAAA